MIPSRPVAASPAAAAARPVDLMKLRRSTVVVPVAFSSLVGTFIVAPPCSRLCWLARLYYFPIHLTGLLTSTRQKGNAHEPTPEHRADHGGAGGVPARAPQVRA